MTKQTCTISSDASAAETLLSEDSPFLRTMGRTPRSPKHTGRDRHLKGVRNKETLAWGLDDEDEDEAHDITPEHSPPQKPTKPRLTKADPELARLDAVLESGTDLQKANPEMAELRCAPTACDARLALFSLKGGGRFFRAHGVEALDEALLQRMEIAVARRPSKEELVRNGPCPSLFSPVCTPPCAHIHPAHRWRIASCSPRWRPRS